MTEAEIIKRCKNGDQQAFRQLVDRYAPKLMGICLRYMHEEFAAEDVLQESFIRIFKSISSYKSTGSFEAWLSKITVRSALITLRKNKKLSFHLELNNNHEKHYENAGIEIELDEADIIKMIGKLPEHYRIIFNMYVIEEFSHKEISELLEIPESTSRTKLTRARRKMQKIYLETSEKKKEIYNKVEDREILKIS